LKITIIDYDVVIILRKKAYPTNWVLASYLY